MDAQPVAVPSDEPPRRRLRLSAGVVAVGALVLLLIAIGVGVYANQRHSKAAPASTVTIADLLANPDAYDERDVTLSGTAEDIRAVPYLSQYALYTFRDATGTLRVLSQRGTPPAGQQVRLTGTFHSKARLDDVLTSIVKARFGSLAGSVVGAVVPSVGLHVVFMEHLRYAAQ